MRVDYFHTGGPRAGETHLRSTASSTTAPWPGSRTQLRRPDQSRASTCSRCATRATARCSTRAASRRSTASGRRPAKQKTAHRTFHESLRFPWPQAAGDAVTRQKRQADNSFAPIWTTEVDPASRFVNRAPLARARRARSGRCSRTARQRRRWTCWSSARATRRPRCRSSTRDVQRLLPALFAEEPFKSRRADFNVRALDLPSAESGVNRPNAGVFRRTPLSAEYNIFDSERYVLTLDNRALRDAASAAPYEFIEILVNEQDLRRRRHLQRSGDRLGRQRVLAVRVRPRVRPSLRRARRRVLHVGRRLRDRAQREAGALGAERHRAARSGRAEMEDLVTPGTPLPTPWDKAEFEAAHRGHPAAPARDPRAQRARSRDGRALPRAARLGHEVPGVDEVLAARSARSKAPPTRRRDSTGRRPTASCSRATRSGSAASAGARSARIIDLYSK